MTTSRATPPLWSRHLLVALALLIGACSSEPHDRTATSPRGSETAGMSGPARPQPMPSEGTAAGSAAPAPVTPADAGPPPARPPQYRPTIHREPTSTTTAAMPPPAPPPPAQPFCEVIGDAATPEECARITAYRDNLRTGSAAFNAPSRMLRGETVLLRLVIDKAANSAAPAAAVDALPGDTTGFATKVGRYMRAELSGDGFKVAPRDADASRDLFAATQAQWEWDVTALSGGDHVLTLKTFVQVVDSAGNKQPMGEIVTENRSIHVDVDTAGKSSDFIDDTIGWFGKGTNLLKALATLLGAALAAWLAFKKFRG